MRRARLAARRSNRRGSSRRHEILDRGLDGNEIATTDPMASSKQTWIVCGDKGLTMVVFPDEDLEWQIDARGRAPLHERCAKSWIPEHDEARRPKLDTHRSGAGLVIDRERDVRRRPVDRGKQPFPRRFNAGIAGHGQQLGPPLETTRTERAGIDLFADRSAAERPKRSRRSCRGLADRRGGAAPRGRSHR